MSKESAKLRKLIGKRVKITRGEHEFVGTLLGQLETWRTARPDLSADNPDVAVWGAINGTEGRLREFYFAENAGAEVALAA